MSSDRIRLRLQDIVDNADWIAEYLGDASFEMFQQDRKTVDAVERCLARITEAVIQLGDEETARQGLGVSWNEVRGLGNKLRHEYRRLNRRVIYDTARDDVPALRDAALRALAN